VGRQKELFKFSLTKIFKKKLLSIILLNKCLKLNDFFLCKQMHDKDSNK